MRTISAVRASPSARTVEPIMSETVESLVLLKTPPVTMLLMAVTPLFAAVIEMAPSALDVLASDRTAPSTLEVVDSVSSEMEIAVDS